MAAVSDRAGRKPGLFRWRLGLAIVVAAVVAAYAAALAYLVVYQRDYVFLPSTVHVTPVEAGLSEAREIALTASDGVTTLAWFLPPAPGKATILTFHGQAERIDRLAGRFRAFHAEGLGVLGLSYRGYGGSGGAPTEEGFDRDAEAAWRWLTAQVPAERIAIHGYSMGTGVATALAARHPAGALVLEAPFLSAVAVAELRYPYFPVRFLMRDPFRSDEEIGKVRMPLLVIHGTNDRIVPYEQGQALFALANEPKTFLTYEGAGHLNLADYGSRQAVVDFVEKAIR